MRIGSKALRALSRSWLPSLSRRFGMRRHMDSRNVKFREHSIRLYGDEKDNYFKHINFEKNHTNDFFIHVLDRCVSSRTTAIDVGANIGVTTALLATVVKEGAIYSFEPSPIAFPFLKETIRANRIANAYPQNLALSDRLGTANFFDNPMSASASHLATDGTLGGNTTAVEMTTLDEFAVRQRIERVDFVKIDVEGFEAEVLDGAKEIIRRDKPGVFIEFNSFTLIAYGNKNPRTVLEKLMATFSHVYFFEGGQVHQIMDSTGLLHFLHENLVRHHCVDDLYCCSEPLRS
jgi:FkbM family methyltransferase